VLDINYLIIINKYYIDNCLKKNIEFVIISASINTKILLQPI